MIDSLQPINQINQSVFIVASVQQGEKPSIIKYLEKLPERRHLPTRACHKLHPEILSRTHEAKKHKIIAAIIF